MWGSNPLLAVLQTAPRPLQVSSQQAGSPGIEPGHTWASTRCFPTKLGPEYWIGELNPYRQIENLTCYLYTNPTYPWRESNPHLMVRSHRLCPLSYRGNASRAAYSACS